MMTVGNTIDVFIVRLLLNSFADVTISFEMEQFSAESDGEVEMCVILRGQTERVVTVTVISVSGSASGEFGMY